MEIAFDHIHRGLAEARAGRANYWEEDADGGKAFKHPDIRETVEEAYHALISGRLAQAIALLDSVVYPDGKPLHEQVIEWFRYLKNSEPVPEGWEIADSLDGTHHGHHARLIRKVA
jgi:hypothetical protein